MDEWPEPETLKSPCLCAELMLCNAVLDIVGYWIAFGVLGSESRGHRDG